MEYGGQETLMRRCVRIGLCALAALGVFWATASKADQDETTDCVLVSYYPLFTIAGSDKLSGVSIEVLRVASKRAGRTIKIEMMPFQPALYALQNDRACLLPALFRNASREGRYRWIASYHSAELKFLSIGPAINTLQEGRALDSIAVETDASANQFLSSMGFENLARIPNPASSARMLQAGRVVAWAQSVIAANRMWADLDLGPELQAGDPIHILPVYVAAGLDYPDDLAEIYATSINSLTSDGSVARIIASYE